MKRIRKKLQRIMLLTAALVMMMAGAAMAQTLTSWSETKLSSKGYELYSDFTISSARTITADVYVKTTSGAALTQKSLSSMVYKVINRYTGKTYTYRYGGYTQVASTASWVHNRLSVYLPKGNYRFRTSCPNAAVQPLTLSYTVKDGTPESGLKVTSPVTVNAGKRAEVIVTTLDGKRPQITGATTNNSSLKLSWNGAALYITADAGAATATSTVTVKASYGESKNLSKTITVKVKGSAASGVRLQQTALTLTPGQTAKLALSNLTYSAKATWMTSNSKVATVTRNGSYATVKAVASGSCNISASYGGRIWYCRVTVTSRKPLFKIYIRSISSDYRTITLRVYNATGSTMKFSSTGARIYMGINQEASGENDQIYGSSFSSALSIRYASTFTVKPYTWTTLTLRTTYAKLPSRDRGDCEIRLPFTYGGISYIAAVEDRWIDGDYCLKSAPGTWYATYRRR